MELSLHVEPLLLKELELKLLYDGKFHKERCNVHLLPLDMGLRLKLLVIDTLGMVYRLELILVLHKVYQLVIALGPHKVKALIYLIIQGVQLAHVQDSQHV